MTAAAPLSIGEIASALDITKRSAERRARGEGWAFETQTGRGGERHIYDVAALPADVREAIVQRMARVAAPARALPAVPAAAPTGLSNQQRTHLEARAAILQHIETLASAGGLDRAVRVVVDAARRGELPPPLQGCVRAANARAGDVGDRTLSRRSIYRWIAARNREGNSALAPKAAPAADIPAWAPALLKVHQNPQCRSLAHAMELLPDALAGTGIPAPNYHQARRFLGKVSTVDQQRGRMGPRALKSIRPYVKRDVSELLPLDVVMMDGHTHDAEVGHPSHGQPFRPEITSVIDARTRVLLGWSAGLAESAHAVMDALRCAVSRHGVPAILYVDNGSGYEADIVSNEVTGFLARVGTQHKSSLPYNSQARGQIERLHQTVWVRGARTLPTFIGADMDAEAKKKVHKLTRTDIVARRRLMMDWPQFLRWCADQVDAYNDRPHRGLPKIRDAATGERRHMTPNEAWAAAIAEGFEPVRLVAAELDDLFRPHREVTVVRGQVQVHGNSYFAAELEHWHGERVHVAYDIHDPAQVWVKNEDGRLITVAKWEANRRAFFPRSVVDQARDQRAAQRQRRLEVHLDEVRAERDGVTIEAEAEPLSAEVIALADAKLAQLEPPAPAAIEPVAGERPAFIDDGSFIDWLRAHPDEINDNDRAYLREQLARSNAFRLAYGDLAEVIG